MRLSLRNFRTLMILLVAIAARPALADWRTDLGIFRVGMIEASAPPQKGREALRRSFEAALGMPVEIIVLRDWPQLIDAQASSRVNYAVYSATAYAATDELCRCIEPLAAPVDVDGAIGVRSVVLSRAGKASDLDDLRDIKVAVPAVDDLTGWLVPMALLPDDGLRFDGSEPFFLKSSTATDALSRFRSGEADAIFGWEKAEKASDDPLPGGTASQAPEVKTVVLWRSPLIKFGPHAVLSSLDREAKEILSAFLLDLHAANPQAYDLLSQGHGGGFAAAAAADYAVVREIVRNTAQRN